MIMRPSKLQSLILLLTISMTISAPAPHPEPNPAPAADPAAKPAITPVVYSPPVAVSYNAFSTLQTHPSSLILKSSPAVLPAIQSLQSLQSLPTVYTLQAQAAPALGKPLINATRVSFLISL